MDRVPDQYNELILKASKVGRFSVHKVQPNEILSFKNWWPKSYKKITVSDFRRKVSRAIPKDQKITFKMSTFKHFEYQSKTPEKLVAHTIIGGLASAPTFTLRKTAVVPSLPTAKAYPLGKVPVNKKKLDDVRKLYGYVAGYEDFYNTILQWPTTEEAGREFDSEVEND